MRTSVDAVFRNSAVRLLRFSRAPDLTGSEAGEFFAEFLSDLCNRDGGVFRGVRQDPGNDDRTGATVFDEGLRRVQGMDEAGHPAALPVAVTMRPGGKIDRVGYHRLFSIRCFRFPAHRRPQRLNKTCVAL